ncbi:MAG: DNA-3-methyladenine glycosylase 2 family protein [Magnetospirillum sp.]|nr:DNA-3-methyladenine glycosylase 2 family protein [Magnetospirillum sp.]
MIEAQASLADRHLSEVDPVMATLVARLGPHGVSGGTGGFATLANMIIGQQLSRAAATTIRSRLEDRLGGGLTPDAILSAEGDVLRNCGLSRPKIAYLCGLARRVVDGELDFDSLRGLPDQAAIEALTATKGVGRWTAEMYLIFVLGRLDVLPLDDAALRASYCRLYDVPPADFKSSFLEAGRRWSPYGSVACWYLYAHTNGDWATRPGLV